MTKMQLRPTLPDCLEIPEKWEKYEVKAEKQTAAAHCPFYLFLCKAERKLTGDWVVQFVLLLRFSFFVFSLRRSAGKKWFRYFLVF